MTFRINNVLTFLLFLFLPTQLGKHFFLDFSFINGVRVDYLAPTVYLIDIVVFLLFVINWKVILEHVKKRGRGLTLLLLLIGLNIAGAKEPVMALYVVGRVVEILALFLIFSHRDPSLTLRMTRGTFGMTLLPLFIGSMVELFLSLSQLITQHSLQGIFYFLGERAFSVSTPGIATISMFGNQVLRAYGTFSHPNSLGGFYLLVYTFVLMRLVETRGDSWRLSLLRYGLLLSSSLLVLLSFSKVAIVCFVLVNAYYSLKELKIDCRFCKFARIFGLGVVSLIFLSGQSDVFSLEKRVVMIKQSIDIFIHHPLFGVGLGNYLYSQALYTNPYTYFFLQPVHSIYLLFLAEAGLLLNCYIAKLLWESRKVILKNKVLVSCLFIIGVTGFFDHYWLTLVQNQILVGVVLGIATQERPA